MSHAHFIARRKRLLKHIGDGVAIVPTAPEVIRNRDAHHLYRFDSYFWYLTGFPEPEAVVVLIGGKKPKSILFCREKHEEREIWDGYRYGPKAAKAAFGFDAAYPIEQLAKKLPEFLVDRDTLWHAIGHDAAVGRPHRQGSERSPRPDPGRQTGAARHPRSARRTRPHATGQGQR